MKIDSITGHAVALNEGQVTIIYQDTVQYKTKVYVYKVADCILAADQAN